MAKKTKTITKKEIALLAIVCAIVWISKVQDQHLLVAHGQGKTARQSSMGTIYVPTRAFRDTTREVPSGDFIEIETSNQRDSLFVLVPYSPGTTAVPSTASTFLEASVDAAEKQRFLQKFTNRQKLKSQGRKPNEREWENLLKNAAVTFAYVREAFLNAAGSGKGEVQVADILANANMSQRLFDNLGERFGLSVQEIEHFAKKDHGLAEWAIFVEERQR